MYSSAIRTASSLLLGCSAWTTVHAAKDHELIQTCRGVMAAAEPARRTWLQRDLLSYELHAATGASRREMRVYRDNLVETCSRVAYNNRYYRTRHHPSAAP